MGKRASNSLVIDNIVSVSLVVNLVFLFFFFFVVLSVDSLFIERLTLPRGGAGPESTAFDWAGRGPYTAIADGRILKYVGRDNIGFVNYAYTVKNRPARLCDGTNDTKLAKTCGRGLGLGFHYKSNKLYVADATYGLVVVPPGGGVAKQLVNSAEGVPFKFCDAVEVDQGTNFVYLIDLSAKYDISQLAQIIATGDMSGRLMKYDTKTKKVTVLMRNLAAPAGVAISKDGSYLVFTEYIANRVQKYWLKGPKANTAEIIINASGNLDNIKRNDAGDFWVAENIQTQGTVVLRGLRINGDGTLLETVTFSPEFNTTSLSEVFEYEGFLILGFLYSNYIGVYRRDNV